MTQVSSLFKLFFSTIFILQCTLVNAVQEYNYGFKFWDKLTKYNNICDILYSGNYMNRYEPILCSNTLQELNNNGFSIDDLKNFANGLSNWNIDYNLFKHAVVVFGDKKWPSDAAGKLLRVYSPYQIENINEILNKESWNFWQPYYDTEGFAESFGLYISMYDFVNNKNTYLDDVNEYKNWYKEKLQNDNESREALHKNLFGCDYEQLKVMSDYFKKGSITTKEEKIKLFEAVCPEGKIQWKPFILKKLLDAYNDQKTIDLKTIHALKYGYETIKEFDSKKYIQLGWYISGIKYYLSNCYKYSNEESCVRLRFKTILKSMKIFMEYTAFYRMININQSYIEDKGLLDIISYMDYFGYSFSTNSNSQSETELSNKIITNFLNFYRSPTTEEREILISFVLYNAMEGEWSTEDLSDFLDKTLNKYNFVAYDYYRFFDVVKCKNVNEVLGVIEFFSKLDKSPAVFYDYSNKQITVKNNIGLLLDINDDEKLKTKKELLKNNPQLYEYPNKFSDGCNIKFISSVVNFYLKTSNKNKPNEEDIKFIYDKVCVVEKTKEDNISEIINNAEDIKSLKEKLP